MFVAIADRTKFDLLDAPSVELETRFTGIDAG